ncbi:MAG: GNAT family N-acetyltransferase [Saprospiraceae bacterium]
MSFSIQYRLPDTAFWEQYTRLWENSKHRSPFQSPSILRYYAEKQASAVAVFQYAGADGELLGAALFKRDKEHFSFLSDIKTDANFFVLHRNLKPDETRRFFEHLLETVERENWALMLNHKPAWADYTSEFEAIVKKSPLYAMNLDYSVCPVAEAETPDALFQRVENSGKFRYYATRVSKATGMDFEVFEDDNELEAWAEAYCRAHVKRWNNTSTPSSFLDAKRREILLGCLQAWSRDNVLVRFSINSRDGRIGFAIGLREERSLIFHATTFDPDYAKYSPGKALIHFIASWMVGEGLSTLDFGDGNEAYKYEVASREQVLRRVFLSRKTNLRFILKTLAIKVVRENPGMFSLYQNRLKPFYLNLKRRAAVFMSLSLCFNQVEYFLADEQFALVLAS